MSRIEHAFRSQYELTEMLSKSIAKRLDEAIRTKGKATLIVSGGSTPIPLFKRLCQIPLAWKHIEVGLCDERWLPPSNEASNENLVKKYLLQEKASRAAFTGMYIEGMEPEEAQGMCEKKLQASLIPFDVVILGMGNDAHTASLFPQNSKLHEAFDLDNKAHCIAIEPHTAPYKRMSLTRQAILGAAHIFLHFEGEEKLKVYQKAIRGDDMYSMPIRSVLNQEIKDIEVYYA